ncbi:hypothetical protein SY88_06895 [Clostridiales bacterium PH28_bin88]|nr:hypothetical protein SY88_06895 [Clostridiales bacterium PH28_bin88]
MHGERLGKLRHAMAGADVEALLVSKPENRAYMSGFTGSAGFLVITPEKAFLVTDFRYVEQAEAQAPDFQVVRHGSQVFATLQELVAGERVSRLSFEKNHLSYHQYTVLTDTLAGVQLVPIQGLVERLRQIKDEVEIQQLREAVRLSDEAFRHVLPLIRPGVREVEIAAELEYFMRKSGAEKPAFDTVVASGPRGALPHGVASERRLAAGDLVVMDFGAVYRGYHSDVTRTVVVGDPTGEQRRVYELVLKAQLEAIAAVRPGLTGAQVDAVARDIIEAGGHGSDFGHSLGHGVGLAIHEEPRLAAGVDTVLEPGMTVTVEPGIYLAQWGGVRIEDTVVVRPGGCEVLTGVSKELLVI